MTQIEQALTKLYKEDKDQYQEKLGYVKSFGAKVYRNNNGEHKVVANIEKMLDYLDTMYGDSGLIGRHNRKIFLEELFK